MIKRQLQITSFNYVMLKSSFDSFVKSRLSILQSRTAQNVDELF